MLIITFGPARQTLSEYVREVLDNRFDKVPAFFDGDTVVTLRMKYRPVQVSDGVWSLEKEQELSAAGFERNLSTWCEPMQGDCTKFTEWLFPADMHSFQFNACADAYRKGWTERRAQADEARQQKAQAERDAQADDRAVTAAHRASIDALVAGAKFTRQAVTLTMDPKSKDDSTKMLEDAKRALVYKGIAIHRVECSWKLTHIASGLSMGYCFDKLADAKICAVRLTTFIDWTQESGKVIARLVAFPHASLNADVYAMIDYKRK